VKKIAILGATGSIGLNTAEIVLRFPDKFQATLLVANTNVEKMHQLALSLQPKYVAMMNSDAALLLRTKLGHQSRIHVLDAMEQVCSVLESTDVDSVMAAIVGSAGLKPTLSAVRAGKQILLANKESLVMTGELFLQEAQRSGAQILPVDSEHNAIFQCLPTQAQQQLGLNLEISDYGIHKVLLTGSGGTFLKHALSDLADVTPEQACRHPNWSMGKKISVDSATMMNKGLEYIEARWLFNLKPDALEVIVHPESIIHSMVQYHDGSTLAQLGQPDMKTPIAHCMSYPERQISGVEPLDFTKLNSFTFLTPDFSKFANLKLAMDACNAGQAATTALNAVNEVAVAAFLNHRIGFLDIAALNQKCLDSLNLSHAKDLATILDIDCQARALAQKLIG
jgi:1-deoxy-D-xylulose-5-phosphate reductoisomerase